MYPVKIFCKENPYEIYFSFAALCPKVDTIILFYCEDLFSKEVIERDKNRINETHQNKTLQLFELYRRNSQGYLGINVTPSTNLMILPYNSIIDPTEDSIQSGTTYNALDLVFILNEIDNFYELLEFINWVENSGLQWVVSFGGISSLYLTFKLNEGVISEGAIDASGLWISHEMCESHIYEFYTSTLKDYPYYLLPECFSFPHQWKYQISEYGYIEFINKSIPLWCLGTKINDNGFILIEHHSSTLENLENINLINQIIIELFQKICCSVN